MATTTKSADRYTESEKQFLAMTKKQLLTNVGKLEGFNPTFGEKPLCLQEALEMWSKTSHGLYGKITRTPAITKLLEEAKELEEAMKIGNPIQMKSEAIDVLMTLVAVFAALDVSIPEVILRIVEKDAINKTRKWMPMPDGTFQSIKPKNIEIGPWQPVDPRTSKYLTDCSSVFRNAKGYEFGIAVNTFNNVVYQIPEACNPGCRIGYENIDSAIEQIKRDMIEALSLEELKPMYLWQKEENGE